MTQHEPLHEGSICPIELTIGEWNQLLTVLMDAGPYRIVNPLIMKIGNSVRTFASLHTNATAPALPMQQTNGEARS